MNSAPTAPTLYLRDARQDDVDRLFQWRYATAAWLAQTYGTDQWSTPYPRERIEHWVDQGATVMASLAPGDEPVATITMSPDGDSTLWTQEELDEPARYIFKANVIRRCARRGIGAVLIDWACTRAAKAGVDVARIDVWSTNDRLHEYYLRRGWRYLRTVPDVTSGALFERPVTVISDLPVVEGAGIRVR